MERRTNTELGRKSPTIGGADFAWEARSTLELPPARAPDDAGMPLELVEAEMRDPQHVAGPRLAGNSDSEEHRFDEQMTPAQQIQMNDIAAECLEPRSMGLSARGLGEPRNQAAISRSVCFPTLRAAGIVAACLLGAPAIAASFDCARARTATEHLVCGTAELSALDEQLARAYQAEVASSAQPDVVRSEQRAWIVTIRNHCADTTCLRDEYQARIRALTHQDGSIETLHDGKSPRDEDANFAESAEPAPEPWQETVPESTLPHRGTEPRNVIQPHSPPPAGDAAAPTASVPEGVQVGRGRSSGDHPYADSLRYKWGALGLILLLGLSVFLHKKGKLTIYSCYTDAAITSLSPLIGIGAYFLLIWLEIASDTALKIAVGIFAVLVLLVLRSTAMHNKVLSPYFLMALVTKIVSIGLYGIVLLPSLIRAAASGANESRGPPGKHPGESEAAYANRLRVHAVEQQRREINRARVERIEEQRLARSGGRSMAAAALLWLSAWVCRKQRFTSLQEYLTAKP